MAKGEVCGVRTPANRTRDISGERVGLTQLMTSLIIASLIGVTLNISTPDTSLSVIVRIYLCGNYIIGSAQKFGATNEVITYCVVGGFVDRLLLRHRYLYQV